MTAVVLFSITRPLSGITGSSRPVRTVAGWRLLKSVRHHSVVQSQSMSHSLSLWYLVHDRVWTEGCGRKGFHTCGPAKQLDFDEYGSLQAVTVTHLACL